MVSQNKAVFLDRDGTINVDYGYVGDAGKFDILPGVIEALRLLADHGYLLFIISNQSGVNRGYYTESDLKKVHDKMTALFKKEGIVFSEAFYCLHRPDEKCGCRKPSPKAVLDIAGKFDIDLSKSWFIGDRESDIQTGKNSGTGTVLVSDKELPVKPDHRVKGLYEAALFITGKIK